MHHDYNNAENDGTYNYGYQYTGGEIDNFRTILAYDCGDVDCPKVQRFSSPNVYYNGIPVGDSSTADNAHWITERLSSFAQYRNSVSCSSSTQSLGSPTPAPTTAHSTTMPVAVSESESRSLQTSLDGGLVGAAGSMFDVRAKHDITNTNFAVHSSAATMVTIDVYTMPTSGSCVGFQQDESAWKLIGTTSIVSNLAGQATILPMGFMDPVPVSAGDVQAFYVTFRNTTNYNRYSEGTKLGAVIASNDDVECLEGYAKGYPFAEDYYPRRFDGMVFYDLQ